VKLGSLSLAQLFRFEFKWTSGRWIGTNVPDGPDENVFLGAFVNVKPNVSGSSSSNSISAPGVFCGVPVAATPPKATRRADDCTEFHTPAACRMAFSAEGYRLLLEMVDAAVSLMKKVIVLLGRMVRSYFSGTGLAFRLV